MDPAAATVASASSASVTDVRDADVDGTRVRCALVTNAALSLDDMQAWLLAPDAGAVATFIGTTRNSNHGRAVLQLEYEAAPSLALKIMHSVAGEVATAVRGAGANLTAVYVAHRVGIVPVMHTSVMVGVSSPHRREALEATARIIDKVKARVPVWKKERYADGTAEWRENCECSWSHKL